MSILKHHSGLPTCLTILDSMYIPRTSIKSISDWISQSLARKVQTEIVFDFIHINAVYSVNFPDPLKAYFKGIPILFGSFIKSEVDFGYLSQEEKKLYGYKKPKIHNFNSHQEFLNFVFDHSFQDSWLDIPQN